MDKITVDIDKIHEDYSFEQLLYAYGFNGLIPSNRLINKYRTGIRATTCELEAKRHSIIIAPYVDILRVKKQRHGNSVAILMDGISSIDVIDHLNDGNLPFKKIMVVPEGFPRLLNILMAEWASYRKDFFLLFDEFEKLVEDCLFRKEIIKAIDELFLFDNKALLSATPLIPSDPRFEEHNFKLLELKPTWDFRKKLKLFTTQNINTSIRNYLSLLRDDKPVFFFTNCKRTILYLTRLDQIKDNFKVFCSETLSSNYFLQHGVPSENIRHSVSSQDYDRYNIFTSRFNSGIDMMVDGDDLPHIVIITNLPHVRHSVINPFTTAIQIMGRCRKGISSITHISSIDSVSKQISEEDLHKEVDHWIWYVKRLRDVREIFKNKTIEDGLSVLIDKEFISMVFKNNEINTYHMDALINKLQTLNLYTSSEKLASAYLATGYFNLKHEDVKHSRSELDKLVLDRKVGKKQIMRIVFRLEMLSDELERGNPLMDEDIEWILRVEDKHTVIFELFCEFGAAFFDEIKYHKTKMFKEYVRHKLSLRSDRYADMVDIILTYFKSHVRYYSDELTQQLQEIYDRFGYSRDHFAPCKAKAIDILDYFEAKYNDGKYKHPKHGYKTSYLLGQPRLKLSSDLHALYNNSSIR